MGTLFFLPLTLIALFETHFDRNRSREYEALMEEPDEFGDAEEDPEPCTKDDDYGVGDDPSMKICTVDFEQLKKKLPNLTKSVMGEVLSEVRVQAGGLGQQDRVVNRAHRISMAGQALACAYRRTREKVGRIRRWAWRH